MTQGDDVRRMIREVESDSRTTLNSVERLLMATDGTVTHMLEALTRGEVSVTILHRSVENGVLSREVVLEREVDGSRLVWSDSDIYLDVIDGNTANELVDGEVGIGDLLRSTYADTWRRVVDMKRVTRDVWGVPQYIDSNTNAFLYREYEVHSGGDVLMVIREYFPRGVLHPDL